MSAGLGLSGSSQVGVGADLRAAHHDAADSRECYRHSLDLLDAVKATTAWAGG